MAITPNPVTAFRKSGKTPPKPPNLWESEVFGKLYGTSPTKSVKPKTTTLEEEAKLSKAAQTTKSRINLSPTLTPKQKQELIAEADRIAAGERRQVSVGGPTPSLFKKLQDVAYSKILSPFKSAYKTGGDISIESQGKAWAGLIGGIIKPADRLGQSITKELSDLQLSIKNPVLREVAKGAGGVLLPLQQIGADIVSMGNKKEQLLQRPDVGEDKVQFSIIDMVNQAKDPDWGLKKTVIAKRNAEGNKFIGGAQNLIAEEITKPLNYVTGVGEVQYIGKAGRIALAAKFQTVEMIAKYPVLADKANEITRIGMWAIPREIRLAEGINTGLRLAGKPVQWTEPLADVIGKGWALTRAQIGDISRATASLPFKVKGFDVVPALVTPASRIAVGVAGRKVKGEYVLSNAGAIRGLAGWSAANAGKGETGFAYIGFKSQVKEIIDEAREQGVAGKLISLIENPDLPRSGH
jgi:hypothetical protein